VIRQEAANINIIAFGLYLTIYLPEASTLTFTPHILCTCYRQSKYVGNMYVLLKMWLYEINVILYDLYQCVNFEYHSLTNIFIKSFWLLVYSDSEWTTRWTVRKYILRKEGMIWTRRRQLNKGNTRQKHANRESNKTKRETRYLIQIS